MTEQIVCADARDFIKDVEPNSIDLAVLDPNYNDWDDLCQSGFMHDVYAAMKPTGNVICFTKQPFDHNLRQFVNPLFRREIIWSFSNGGAWVSPRMPLVSFQKLFWLAVTDQFYFNPRTGLEYAPATQSMKRGTKVFGDYCEEGKEFVKSEDGTWLRDHYHFNKPTSARVFAKPIELIQTLVTCFSPPGGVVLDPFFGSGVVGDACVNLNRDILGCEIDKASVEAFMSKREQMLF